MKKFPKDIEKFNKQKLSNFTKYNYVYRIVDTLEYDMNISVYTQCHKKGCNVYIFFRLNYFQNRFFSN